jgi:hypothetical protein
MSLPPRCFFIPTHWFDILVTEYEPVVELPVLVE